jgi:hypothetical protein
MIDLEGQLYIIVSFPNETYLKTVILLGKRGMHFANISVNKIILPSAKQVIDGPFTADGCFQKLPT